MASEEKEMASKYFFLIYGVLYSYAKGHDEEDQVKLKLYELDARILRTFCFCIQRWDYYKKLGILESVVDDEQRKEVNITHLKRIWVQEEEEDNKLDIETWPKHIQDFDPITFGLERKIEQSKPLIERWCPIFIRSSSMQMHFISSRYLDIISHVYFNVHDLLEYRAAEIAPFKNQIDILKDMLLFVFDTWHIAIGSIDSKELLEYVNFIHAFSYNAACFICLYWAKEANEETAAEMNNALFDMLHKIKPCVGDVTASYFGVLKSSLVDFFFGHTIFEERSFVDFFFGHTILKDDYLILRERLILLFTFLADASPKEKEEEEEEEGDVIRSQIYALLREDAYLLLQISELKQDFSKNKMLLSDLMNKIDILNTNIIRLYCTPSDSWNRLEAAKMNNVYFASLQRELSSIKHHAWRQSTFRPNRPESYTCVLAQLHLYLMDIRFLRSIFQCFETWDDSEEETRIRLSSIITSLQRIWGQENDMVLLSGRLYAIRKRDIGDWEHLLDLELKEKFKMSKQEINAWLISLSHCSFHCMPSTSNKILIFLDSVIYNMSKLVNFGAGKDVVFTKQIEILEEKLLLLKNLFKLTTNRADISVLEEFEMLVQGFANNAACLIYVYWAKEVNDEIPAETNHMLSNMLRKIKPATPEVARMYIITLKAICMQPYDSLLLEQTATSFVDYFFEDLVTPWKNDFQILRDEVIFHLTFVHHHHTGNVGEIICSQLDVLFSDGVYGLLPFDDMKGDLSEKKIGLSDFMMNIRTENAKIRQLHCKLTDSFVYNFPKIIGQGFLDCLIQKLRNLTERMISDQKYVSSAKCHIITIDEELTSLTPIFNQILESKDLNDAWLEVVNVVYLAEHVISLCFIFYHLICHYILYLSDVVDRIKVVRRKLEKIQECNMYNASTLLEQDRTSEINGVMVGFEEDINIIMDNITRGTEFLDIVSIVGMGGLGKTTLAKKVYGSSLVKSHFHIFAFSSVSHDHNKRRLLLDILREGVDVKTSSMNEDDLAHKLKKCLSCRKYFIVLDDIWNINAWDEVKSSFPDDRNGSRVMFTTRSLEVAERCQIKCTPHQLRFLSEDESWNLLQNKLFHNDMPPPDLSSVAKLIAKKCDGLPLSIVVIAGLLARTKRSLWTEISKAVGSYLFDEGCMNILELSYKHLPEYLKPCLLYLGAFPEDTCYRVDEVTLLWIDEGFIKESKTKSLNDVAKDYLYELVYRSLIIVDKRTIGEIRTFRVHDLIHDFSQKKCLDKNFFQLGHGIAASSFSDSLKYSHNRVSVQKQYEPLVANTCSLFYFAAPFDYSQKKFPLQKFRFAQVLYFKGIELQKSDFAQVTSLIDLRHIKVSKVKSIPSSISNLWNMQSLILTNVEEIDLPETLWRMKSLRHVKVNYCKLNFSDSYELNAFPQLDKVVSFSRPNLSTVKDVERLLQRLPAVKEMDCILDFDSIEERVDFHRKLESLKLCTRRRICLKFPSTLIKLKLQGFELSWMLISAITELECLRILKLLDVSFPGPTWETEDVTFPNLKYFKLRCSNLVRWNANTDLFPCLEQLFVDGTTLEELPPCFREISSLKKITVKGSPKLQSSAIRLQEEQIDLGNKVELVVSDGNLFG